MMSDAYRRYRSFARRSRAYKSANYLLIGVLALYALLLIFPQILFANQISHKNFNVYSRQPLNEDMIRVLEGAVEKLARSPIYNKELSENLIMADNFGLYKFLTLDSSSFGSTIPVLGHSRINKSDIENDLVFRSNGLPNQRSLTGVVAHETMHNQIQAFLGVAKYYSLPKWKDEGYCEYIAGETTLSFEEGVRLWQVNPGDPSKYEYFKYHQMVKYLLDDLKMSPEDLLRNEFDVNELETQVFEKYVRTK